jgi:hypothetical protein
LSLLSVNWPTYLELQVTSGIIFPVEFVFYGRYLLRRQGKLDFVLMLGDLVDFVEHNYSDRYDYGENSWKLFCDIIRGIETGGTSGEENPGFKVPVFTSTGNHDWRFFPYKPAANAAAYGLSKKSVKGLDPFSGRRRPRKAAGKSNASLGCQAAKKAGSPVAGSQSP